jgi:two-component system phosphate regulon sensor histidine kinase PhoR
MKKARPTQTPGRRKKEAKAADALARTKRALAAARVRLRDAEGTLEALRTGQVDALVVQGEVGDQVFTLRGTDRRYRQLVETMNEGALIVDARGTIVYANRRFAELVGAPLETMIGSALQRYIAEVSQRLVEALLQTRGGAPAKAEVELATRPHGRSTCRLRPRGTKTAR